ncbi:hypothetical protein FRZ44_13020 [Hypericibacter terrae]|jgi:hypothetical protein|uniref:Uncharacterized protein n=1 Tax=Hypericibacter terrae TaxID=2602015 RepID=A0A5J6MF08_9PROT|nr:hypothetical protein [Hypericibacter terrae]QEX16012.1 hypothetical protein FRZ44_13020 [Hypericibacter terrae]
MMTIEDILKRLNETESAVQNMVCTVTADIIMFQAAIVALREDGILTEKVIDRMAIAAQDRIAFYDTDVLGAGGVVEVARRLDNLAERLREARGPTYLPQRPSGLELTTNGNGRGRVRAPRKMLVA